MSFEKITQHDEAERRRHLRVVARSLIRIFRPDGVQVGRISNVLDISAGGLRIICHEPFQPGMPLDVEFNLPDRVATIRAAARIMWIKPMKEQKDTYFAGIQFTNLMEQERRILDEFFGESGG